MWIDRAIGRTRGFRTRHRYAIQGVAVVFVLLAVLTGWFLFQIFAGLPTGDQLRELRDTAEGTTLYDAYDRPVFTIPNTYRVEVTLDRISPYLQKAIVAVEDVRFYEHDGIDGIRLIGALITDLRERRAAEGASTITQQLARMSFLTRDKTLRRKGREAIVAQRIEHLYSKDEILEIYLNKVYFGDGLYGAEAAAQGYFGKPAAALSLGEAAMLAGVVKAPSASNPVASPERAIERRNIVLKLMREHDFIDQTAYNTAAVETLALRDNLRGDDPVGMHFKEVVRRDLVERFGKEMVYQRRLKVFTTIDPDMQKAAEAALTSSVAEIEPRIKTREGEPLQAALLALDPATGHVRAIVGGRDPHSVGLNRAMQTKRQPGSAFKPFVYAAALESGFAPATVIDRLNIPINTYQGKWLPEDEHSTAASMTIRTALRTSSNRAAVRMLETVGLDRTVSYANDLGIGALPNVPSLALGSGEITLASLTSAYAAFAHAGVVNDPVFVRRVEDQNGTILFQAASNPRRAVSETTAFMMAAMLADVIDAGTANRARAVGFTVPAAGKTGTTNDFVDAWFVGFTPKLVAGVWVGFDKPRTIFKNAYAGQLAVPMWARFMKAATAAQGPLWFDPPRNVVAVEVCRLSGLLPAPGCRNAASINPLGELTYKSMAYTDYFVRGTEPMSTCTVHAAEYLPYPEPVFAFAPFDDLGEVLGTMREPAMIAPAVAPPSTLPPPPLPAAVPAAPPPPPLLPVLPSPPPSPPPPPPPAPRRLPDLPSAPPETPPAPPRRLPDLPPAPPETSPQPPPQQHPAPIIPLPAAPEAPPAPAP